MPVTIVLNPDADNFQFKIQNSKFKINHLLNRAIASVKSCSSYHPANPDPDDER